MTDSGPLTNYWSQTHPAAPIDSLLVAKDTVSTLSH